MLAAIIAGLAVLTLTLSLTYMYLAPRLVIQDRLLALTSSGPAGPRGPGSLSMVLIRLRQFVLRLTPHTLVEMMNGALDRAGYPSGIDASTFLFRQAVAILLTLCLLVLLVAGVANLPAALWLVFLWVVVTIAAAPFIKLRSVANRRRLEIQAAFPAFLDLLVVCVEAGLGMDAALQRVAREAHGATGEEFQRAVAEIQVSRSRGDALAAVAKRVGLEDVARFAMAVRQAEHTGVGIASVLRAQAELERDLALRRAEEKAAKIPIKIVVPVVIFVLPGMFMIILGPAVLHLVPLLSR